MLGLLVTLNLEIQEDDGANQNNLFRTIAGVSIYDHLGVLYQHAACCVTNTTSTPKLSFVPLALV